MIMKRFYHAILACGVFAAVVAAVSCTKDATGGGGGGYNGEPEVNHDMDGILRRNYLWNEEYATLSPDFGLPYDEFLDGLVKASGIETPTREDRSKIDKKRKGKGSNKDWKSPSDPDSRITKMKDGRTHLAHKAEHAVDMETGAVVAVTLQGADRGDTTTIHKTLTTARESLGNVAADAKARRSLKPLREAVCDKGYHGGECLVKVQEEHHLRTYVSEPRRGRRKWEGKRDQQAAVYGNRQRIGGKRGKALMRKRGELVERSFAHVYETGGMRRTHLRGHENILKRLLIHTAGFNLSLVFRKQLGFGKPRAIQNLGKSGKTACEGGTKAGYSPTVPASRLRYTLRRLWRATCNALHYNYMPLEA